MIDENRPLEPEDQRRREADEWFALHFPPDLRPYINMPERRAREYGAIMPTEGDLFRRWRWWIQTYEHLRTGDFIMKACWRGQAAMAEFLGATPEGDYPLNRFLRLHQEYAAQCKAIDDRRANQYDWSVDDSLLDAVNETHKKLYDLVSGDEGKYIVFAIRYLAEKRLAEVTDAKRNN